MATEYTQNLDLFLKDTVPQLPGAVRDVAKRELRLAIREFFERSYAWRETITGLDAPAGDVGVELTSGITGDTNADVVGLIGVAYNGTPLRPLNQRPARTNVQSDLPSHFYVSSNPDEFKLYPFLQNAQTGLLDVIVAKTPKPDATDFPRQVETKYYEPIVNGFLSRMYLHPNKPYSSPQMANQLRHVFRRQIAFYQAQAKTGYNGAQAWSFPNTWGVNRVGRNG